MSDTSKLEERLRSYIAAPDDSDWLDVLRRATAIAGAGGETAFKARARNARRWRPALLAACSAALVAGVGVGLAAGFGAFNGISAAQHVQGPSDTLDAGLVTVIEQENNDLAGSSTGQLLVDSARFVRGLPSGERVYALTTTKNMLCVLIAWPPGGNPSSVLGCGDPLNQDKPTTVGSVKANSATPQLTYGVATDDVASVSFASAGVEKTVPVETNVWAYEGPSDALDSLTVHYVDGTSRLLTHG